jgi:predicted DCC family thiol-disulfide oxidoreductase YuxK
MQHPAIDTHSAPVVFYDGYCKLCERSVGILKHFDVDRRLKFIPIQSIEAAPYLQALQDYPDSVLLYSEGKWYSKSDAVLKSAALAGGKLKLLLVLYILPKFVRDYMYDLIAVRRYRWFGKKDSCDVCAD